MIVLSAKELSKIYGVNVILENVTFHINQGDRIGIVGTNGAGKSTLLNILTGELTFDDGEMFVSPSITFGYLKQRDHFDGDKTVYEEMLAIFQPLMEMEAEMTAMSAQISQKSARGEDVDSLLHQYDAMTQEYEKKEGYRYKSEIRGILSSMAFPEEFLEKKIGLLSGGERTRLALAALLLKKPDVLLLDEPTNHLDIGTVKWLEQYLKGYTGTIILISHDRYFLNQTANRIFEIENHKLHCFDGNYTQYADKKRFMEEDAWRQYESQQKEIARQEEIIRRFKQHGTEKLAKRAQSREKKLDKMELVDRPEAKVGKMKLNFREAVSSGNDVLLGKDLAKGFGAGAERRELFSGVDFDVKKGNRICLVGPNGIGKTSLLKIIMGELESDQGYVKTGHNVVFGYYDQEQKLLTDGNTVLEELHSTYRLYTETELRSLLGRFLFRGTDVFKRVSALSGGEKARLALLKLMMSGANLLVMDEPTNHLDIASKEVFEDALMEFPGTMLLVSHDRYFLNKVPTAIYELSERGLTVFAGGYDYYLEKKDSIASGKGYLEQLTKQTAASGAAEGTRQAELTAMSEKEKRMEERRQSKAAETERRRKERQQKELEERIAELEEKIADLEKEMCREEVYTDFEKSTQVSQACEDAKSDLEIAYDSWMILNEEEQ